jgi:hypothetical protein
MLIKVPYLTVLRAVSALGEDHESREVAAELWGCVPQAVQRAMADVILGNDRTGGT